MGIHSLQLLSGGNATSQGMQWTGGRGVFVMTGSLLGGGLEMLASDGSTWVSAPDVSGNAITLSGNGARVFELPPCTVRARVTTGSNIYARIDSVPR